ncbi:hypothetical protein KOW79_005848 [Hemibagrus wyckioides]|uniref:Uncharacterized protein n=1 Tax=Hemibagrus wyckioides TaxID=337641 RepID=A0A9D3SU00_9TELE|nr:hypothetical protein KOW79_005848 [Hemibagrus wyckioides]
MEPRDVVLFFFRGSTLNHEPLGAGLAVRTEESLSVHICDEADPVSGDGAQTRALSTPASVENGGGSVIKKRFLSPEQTNPPVLFLHAAYRRYLGAARKGHIITRRNRIANKHGIMGKQTAVQGRAEVRRGASAHGPTP